MLALTVKEQSGLLFFESEKDELYSIKEKIEKNLGIEMSVNEIEFGLHQQVFDRL